MRILLLAPQPFFQERGTPIAVRLLVETLGEAGHEVDLLTFHEGQDIRAPGLRIHRINPPSAIRDVPIGFSWKKVLCDLYLSGKMVRLLRKNRYDVIHAVEEAIFPAAMVNVFAGKRLVYDMDSLMSEQIVDKWAGLRVLNPVLNLFEKLALRRADLVMPMCDRLAARARDHAPGATVAVVEDIPLFEEGEGGEGEDLRKAFNIRGVLALYVGNLEPYQGIDLLLESAALLDGHTDIDVVIIGGGTQEVADSRRTARRLGVAERVHFTGHRPLARLGQYLRQADILLSPRVHGMNTPMKIYSYLAAGKPVLATGIPSHTQVLDSSCALLVSVDPTDLARGLEKLGQDVSLRETLGSAGKERAEKKYSRESFRKKVLGAYARLESGS